MRTEVQAGGSARVVDVVPVPGGWSLLIDGRSYEVALEHGPEGMVLWVNGRPVPAALPAAGQFGRGRASGHTGAAGPRRIVAPMPGRVVKVFVKPGDEVVPRQPLVVVEAMKMENELRAPAAGSVAEVRIAEGASVDANAVLVVIA